FTQVNSGVNAKMIQLACELLDLQKGERVLDLFCGLGNFSLPLARCVGETGQVVGVEASDEMVQRATENAEANQLSQALFFSQDLTKDFSHHSWAKQGFDALLIDPPRSGAFEVMQYVPNFGAKRIVYVSCNPSTLARDAGVLAQYGYQLKKAAVMDMFTHTEHVESIALFEKIEQFEKTQEIND
nr:23S rRNA (uracil(1939)-C(5))-methyltransferase RlmD [Acinetobacter sp.]